MEIRIEDIPRREVIYLRGVGAYAKVAPKVWDELWAYVKSKDLYKEFVAAFGICWDDPTGDPAKDRKYDACMALSVSAVPDFDEGIAVEWIDGGRYAICRHKGPYRDIGRVFGEIMSVGMNEIEGDYDPERPCLEVYLNDPNLVAPEECLTDLCVPIK
ncbi:MAG: AraC family transcriptional regulator [Magnetovibrionaceae bacterium]